MEYHQNINVPKQLPFLEAVCWDLGDVHALDLNEMLNRYERGWENKGVLADLNGIERGFLTQLAKIKGSWLQVDV
ncbi:MAG: hypothetical protein ACJAS1_002998 [Oleiphilaceae bacterium]|jgi:hypothetical protein